MRRASKGEPGVSGRLPRPVEGGFIVAFEPGRTGTSIGSMPANARRSGPRIGSGFHFRGPEKPDITFLETSTAEFRPDAVSHRHTLKRFTRRADFLYVESKEIVEIDSLGGYEPRKMVFAWDSRWEMIQNETCGSQASEPTRPAQAGGCFDALYRVRSGLAGANAGTSLDTDCAPIPRIAASSIAIPTSKSPYRGFE